MISAPINKMLLSFENVIFTFKWIIVDVALDEHAVMHRND